MDPVMVALRDELEELAQIIEPLDEAAWARPSACVGWSIADTVLHLAQTNEMAAASARGELAEAAADAQWRAGADVDDAAGAAVERDRGATGAEIHARWLRSTQEMVTALDGAAPEVRVRWVVGDMSPRTLATTRIAETWIHTGDIASGLGVPHPPTGRLWHIARLVHRTVPYAFERSGRTDPGGVAFVLAAPDTNDEWTYGDPATAPTVVRGPAHDLCRVAGQRAVASETALNATGPAAEDLLRLIRTFA